MVAVGTLVCVAAVWGRLLGFGVDVFKGEDAVLAGEDELVEGEDALVEGEDELVEGEAVE